MKAPTFLPDCLPRIFLAECGPKGVQGGERKAPCFSAGIFIPRWVFRQLRPEGDWGERREARAQWAQPPKAVSDPEFRQTTSGAHGSANRADCLPRGKPPVRPQAHTPALPPVGPDAPTPARGHGLQPYGALTLFFRWRKKSVQKKASGTATPGKSPLLPILAAGLFPSAAYRRSAPPQSAVGRLIPCGLGCFGVAWKFLHRKRPAGFQIHAGLFKRAMRPVAEWRSMLCKRQGTAPDPRAARPVAERR